VVNELKWNTEVNASEIGVAVRSITVTAVGSRVILTGTVRSWAERQEAERVSWSAPGVTQVENRIKVRP
jgi:osmotically-inducible protein OsmY